MSPPCARMISRAIGRPRPGAARPGRAGERLEQMGARRLGDALAGVRDLDHCGLAGLPGADRDQPAGSASACTALRPRLTSTRNSRSRSANSMTSARTSLRQRMPLWSGGEQAFADLVEERREREAGLFRAHHLGARERQGLGAQPRGAVHGFDEARRHVAHLRVLALLEPVGQQHGVGQEVAQVVVDLADRAAERGKTGLLRERGAQRPPASARARSGRGRSRRCGWSAASRRTGPRAARGTP